MKKNEIKNRNVTILARWMREITWLDRDTGATEHLAGARLLLWARIWTVSQEEPCGIRAADLGAWAGLKADAAQQALRRMAEHGLVRRVPMVQGYGYTAVAPERDVDSDESFEVKGWMVAQLGLRTATEIIAYAIIYRDRHRAHGFYGSPSYVAGWAGCSERAAQYALAKLQTADRDGGPLVLAHWTEDSHGRRRLARKPNPTVYRGWVDCANREARAANPDAFDRLASLRRAGHREVERRYRAAVADVANDMAGDLGGAVNG